MVRSGLVSRLNRYIPTFVRAARAVARAARKVDRYLYSTVMPLSMSEPRRPADILFNLKLQLQAREERERNTLWQVGDRVESTRQNFKSC